MAENLAWLPAVSPPTEGSKTEPRYYVLEYEGSNVSEAMETDNYSTYGVLYNIIAAQEGCPDGWHLSSDIEWKILEKYLGMRSSDANNTNSWRESGSIGGKLKEVGTEHWLAPNTGADNSSGFTALPGGNRAYDNNFHWTNGEYGEFMMSSTGYEWGIGRILSSASFAIGRFEFDSVSSEGAGSVRCIKDAAEANTSPTAFLSVDPPEGTTDTRFMFDASGCRDEGTNPNDLEVRWDFDGDGTWDTVFNSAKIVFHQFTEAGTYTVILEVADSNGQTDTISTTVVVN
jgi:uncharacterized protein (TIGR02145 family)